MSQYSFLEELEEINQYRFFKKNGTNDFYFQDVSFLIILLIV